MSVLVAGLAAAHQQGVSYSDVSLDEGRLRYDLTISNHDLVGIDADGDGNVTSEEVLAEYPSLRRRFEQGIMVDAGGRPCPLTLQDFGIDPTGGVTFRLRGPCSGSPLHVRFYLIALDRRPGYNLAKLRAGGAFVEHVFTRDDVEVTVGASEGVLGVGWRFLRLGVAHVVTGDDHLLFLLALLLVGRGVLSLIGTVTAFTVAHSITLALVTLDLVRLPTRPVEAAIALSIAWAALENLRRDRSGGRWRVSSVFGLVHGFGFRSVLGGLQLPAEGVIAALLGVNLGIEVGQIAIVLVAFPLVAALQRIPARRAIVRLASGAILAVALFWCVRRAFFA